MKKWISVLCAVTMAGSLLAGCAGQSLDSGGSEPSADAAQTEAQAPSAGDSEASGGLKIAIVSSPSGVDDGSFNENIYDGILAYIDEDPSSSVTPVKETTGDVAACIQTVQDIVADYDVIVCCGFQFAGIGGIAQENPDVKFLMVDTGATDAEGNEITLDNVYSMTFKEQEGGFLAGVAAALTTKSGKVAVVNGIAYPSNVNYEYGFMSGVNYANAHFDTKAECVELDSYAGTDVTGANVGGNYVGSFADEATGKVVGQSLIDQGCDVIFVAAGGSGNGVFTAAKENEGVFIIGCDVDQFSDGVNGSGNIILTSALKVMDMNVTKQLKKIADGSFKGENALLGAESDSVGFVSTQGRNQLTDDAISKIEEAYGLIKDGTVVPAANFNEMTPDNFTGL
ncbi:MAG: BMP family ABC transporter substrate-binding protein [Lachnospiraceae bacterium]|nr:BMP family ABC transporter substrate-binding protein [Lachnospiraceae bacterium]